MNATQTLAAKPPPAALRRFIWDIQSMVELTESEREILFVGRDLAARLLADDNALPLVFSTADPAQERQFKLYGDGMERFTIVSTVLAPGQATPIVDESFWQIFGVLRGAFLRRHYALDWEGRVLPNDREQRLAAGAVVTSPARGASQLVNLAADSPAIAIQVFGGDIGKVPRLARTPDGGRQFQPTVFANPPDAPPYDIWSIQTRIED